MRAIRKDLPAVLTTLQQIYDTTGDAQAFGLNSLIASFTGIASIYFLSEVLDILARMNATMQRKTTDFSKLKILLQFTLDELKSLRQEKADWCRFTQLAVEKLEKDYDIEIGRHISWSARSRFMSIKTITEYRREVAIPYLTLQ